ncbi:MAG: hypothetical protein GY699_02870 [Desulfobacteraceae bacterium]|nr:hypothetical protein [Desulfobacteraceae bacterium]
MMVIIGQEKSTAEKRITYDRREFVYTAYSPERRSGTDRRLFQPKNKKDLLKVL